MLALDEEYAFVNFNGRYGYVLQSYIKQEYGDPSLYA